MKAFVKLLIWLSISSFGYTIEIEEINMFDTNRSRSIPVVIYKDNKESKRSVVIINHGYGAKNKEYSFIANTLATCGYFVASIQHDIETDSPLPRTGNLFDRRKPIWERGVKNILFVISELKKIEPQLDLSKVVLIGHSNGGDISMMFATLHPDTVSKVISLDSLRYPFPTGKGIQISRFSAIDTKPDEGVVPITGVEIISIQDAKHIDLCDRGSKHIKNEIQKSIIQFLDN
jgi:predicted esterase